ncbi:hypothetical protein [Paenibacillus gansuensis]|uniref:Uncharacterized protein n=1 Tax=Paenibacillus gansuensis TaxID=306542 RepID=A0ABW5PIS0_9BACL
MPIQNGYTPRSGPLRGCLSVIVDVKPERMVEIECTQLAEKGQRDVVSYDSLQLWFSWVWQEGEDIGLNNEQVRRKLRKLKAAAGSTKGSDIRRLEP